MKQTIYLFGTYLLLLATSVSAENTDVAGYVKFDAKPKFLTNFYFSSTQAGNQIISRKGHNLPYHASQGKNNYVSIVLYNVITNESWPICSFKQNVKDHNYIGISVEYSAERDYYCTVRHDVSGHINYKFGSWH